MNPMDQMDPIDSIDQNPKRFCKESCIVYGMPKEAYVRGAVQKQASLDNIPKTILEMLQVNHSYSR